EAFAEVVATIDGDPTEGAIVQQGQTVTITAGMEYYVNPHATLPYILIVTGRSPADPSTRGGDEICAELFGDDCAVLLDLLDGQDGSGAQPGSAGSNFPVDNVQVTIADDAPVGDWEFNYYVVLTAT